MLKINTLLMPLFFDTDAEPHQTETPEPPLPVPLVLQLLQGLQGLWFMLQVLRSPATITIY